MNIILSDIASIAAYIIPVMPFGSQVISSNNNQTINTLMGNVRIVENKPLREFQWGSIFPVNKNYPFIIKNSLANGFLYVAFIELMKKYKLPIRIIMTTDEKIPFVNTLASIDDFSYTTDLTGDIHYSIKLTEFPETFFEFIERTKEVVKYVKGFNEKIKAKELLQHAGLL